MAYGVYAASTQGNVLNVTVCPNWTAGACPGNDAASHVTYQYIATPPTGDSRTAGQWQTACCTEALALVKAAKTVATSTSQPSLLGLSTS